MDSFITQLRTVLSDQRRELDEVRRKRRELSGIKSELDAKEIEILVGIQTAEETLSKMGEEY